MPPQWSARTIWTVRAVGAAALISIAATVWLGLWITPPDKVQGNLVRLVYVHPPIAWVALYLSFGTALRGDACSGSGSGPGQPFWDRLAGAAMEVSVVFTALTLVTGSIWGRPDLGCLVGLGRAAHFHGDAARHGARLPGDHGGSPATSTRVHGGALVAALITAVDVPIVHFSVVWWHTLHQGATVLEPESLADDPRIHGVDTSSRVRRLHARFRLDARGADADRDTLRRPRRSVARPRTRRALGRGESGADRRRRLPAGRPVPAVPAVGLRAATTEAGK